MRCRSTIYPIFHDITISFDVNRYLVICIICFSDIIKSNL